ncbi:hypothetical protein WN51_07026 [Melipona quadrifasciata]|uniref:Uncharacterized protein n=1 Tax=Melipona quadrifasciata TaxID=166423 RepID=A0A0M9ACI2_9HYME|nr:hypothetical protein WN51_07026 [Melipona quadrifasciata]
MRNSGKTLRTFSSAQQLSPKVLRDVPDVIAKARHGTWECSEQTKILVKDDREAATCLGEWPVKSVCAVKDALTSRVICSNCKEITTGGALPLVIASRVVDSFLRFWFSIAYFAAW